MAIYYPMRDSRYNDGLSPRLIVSSTEEGSLVRREAQLNPIDVGGFNQDENEVPESFLDEFLLLFVRSPRAGGDRFRPPLPFFIPSLHGASGRRTTPAGSHATTEAIEDLNPFSLPIEASRREFFEPDISP